MFNNKQVKLMNQQLTKTQEDLKTIIALNTTAVSGSISSTPSYTPTPIPITNGVLDVDNGVTNSFIWNISTVFNNWHLTKFVYENFDIDVKALENNIWWYGNVAVFKFPNQNNHKYVSSSFVTSKRDAFGNAEIIQPILPNGKKLKPLKVNVDCVIIRSGWNFYFSNSEFSYGQSWQVWPRYQELCALAYIINRNVVINRPRYLNYVKNQNDLSGLKIQQQLENIASDVITVDANGVDLEKVAGMSAKNGIAEMNNQFEYLERQYYFKLDQIKSILGAKVNASESKKERLITDEVNANNQVNNAIIENEFQYREMGIELLNKTFSENVIVKMNSKFEEVDSSSLDIKKQEVKENE